MLKGLYKDYKHEIYYFVINPKESLIGKYDFSTGILNDALLLSIENDKENFIILPLMYPVNIMPVCIDMKNKSYLFMDNVNNFVFEAYYKALKHVKEANSIQDKKEPPITSQNIN